MMLELDKVMSMYEQAETEKVELVMKIQRLQKAEEEKELAEYQMVENPFLNNSQDISENLQQSTYTQNGPAA